MEPASPDAPRSSGGAPADSTLAHTDAVSPRRIAQWLVLGLLPLVALPWVAPYWSATDDPNHLAIGHIVARLGDATTPFAQHFTVHLAPRPYLLLYWLLLPLGRLAGFVVADRILASALIAATPLATLFLLRRVAPRRQSHAFFLLPFATGTFIATGFLNFVLGADLTLLGLALAWGRSDADGERVAPSRVRSSLGASVAVLLGAFAHPYALGLAVLALCVLEAPTRARPDAWKRLAVVLGPATLFAAIAWWRAPGEGTPLHEARVQLAPFATHAFVLLTGGRGFAVGDFVPRAITQLLLVYGAVRALARSGIAAPTRDARFGRLVALLLLGYFYVPFAVGRAIYLDLRLAWLLLPVMAVVVERPRWLRSDARLAMAMIALATLGAALDVPALRERSHEIARIVATGRSVPRGATLLPLDFQPTRSPLTTSATEQAWGFIVLERDVIVPYLFVDGGTSQYGGNGLRPLTFRRAFSRGYLPRIEPAWVEDVGSRADAPLPRDELDALTVASDEADFERRLAAAVTRYDCVLLRRPPTAIVRLLRERMDLVRRDDDLWLFRARSMQPPAR